MSWGSICAFSAFFGYVLGLWVGLSGEARLWRLKAKTDKPLLSGGEMYIIKTCEADAAERATFNTMMNSGH